MRRCASAVEMRSCLLRPNADSPYARPYDIALTFARISEVTSLGSTPNTREPTNRCRSSPSLKAWMRPSSPDRCAMTRISIWL